jgi:hypothetical protein
MLKSCRYYVRDELGPRAWGIISSADFIAASAIGLALFIFGPPLGLSTYRVEGAATLVLTYAAIVLGFSLAGTTLALTLTNDRLVRRLRQVQGHSPGTDGYSDLVFIHSWASIVHWCLVVGQLLAIALVGPEVTFSTLASQTGAWAAACAGAFLLVYGLGRFLIMVLTLSMLARVSSVVDAESGDPGAPF